MAEAISGQSCVVFPLAKPCMVGGGKGGGTMKRETIAAEFGVSPECSVPLAYCSPNLTWYTTNNRDHWIKIQEHAAVRLLRENGFSGSNSENVSSAHSELNRILREEDVDYAGRLAGWPAGLHQVGSVRFLVTHSTNPPIARAGEWGQLRGFLHGMLGEHQLRLFLCWLHFRRLAVLQCKWIAGQALVLIGPPSCGKSFTQHLITQCLGGNVARPWRFMTGSTQFNSDLVAAEHLAIEDEAPSHDIRTRRAVGCAIKTMLFARDQSAHGKGVNAVTLEPRWALSISINDEPENVQVIPPLDDSLIDKIMILKCTGVPRCVPEGMTEKDWLAGLLAKELAAMLYDVDAMQVDEEYRDPRSGVKAFQHPDALEILRSVSPEESLLQLLIAHVSDDPYWQGSAVELERKLRREDEFTVSRLCRSQYAIGTYISRLAKSYPDRIIRVRKSTGNEWRIHSLGFVEPV